VLSVSVANNKISWFENLDGLGNFGPQQTITTNALSARHVIAADLDNDGDMDVISASQNDSKIAWYENLHSLGVAEQSLTTITLVPNPTMSFLEIRNIEPWPLQIKVATAAGKIVLETTLYEQNIDVSTLSSGIYFIEIATQEASVIKKIIKL
jgi:hypothetical protein